MTISIAWRVLAMVALVSLPLLAACQSDGGATAATAAPETVLADEYVEFDATIEAIDAKTRQVTLRPVGGEPETVVAPADVDLARLRKGDGVVFGAYRRLSVRALPAGAAPLGVTREAMMARTGATTTTTPGRAVGEQTRAVLEIAAIDRANHRVTLRGADGQSRTLDVRNPDNQRKLQTLNDGDLVQIDLFEAVVVALRPKGGAAR